MSDANGAVVGIDHVQIAVPVDGEEAARAFYVETIGFNEIPRPVTGAGRSILWVAAGDQQVHFRPDPEFRPGQFAHPGFLVGDIVALVDRLQAAGYAVSTEQSVGPGRFHVRDPFGNRLEFIEVRA